jgi:hypothetical protein
MHDNFIHAELHSGINKGEVLIPQNLTQTKKHQLSMSFNECRVPIKTRRERKNLIIQEETEHGLNM